MAGWNREKPETDPRRPEIQAGQRFLGADDGARTHDLNYGKSETTVQTVCSEL